MDKMVNNKDESDIVKRSFVYILSKHFLKYFAAGILTFVPILITYKILAGLFNFIDSLTSTFVVQIFGQRIYGIGFVFTILFLYLLGTLSSNLAVKYLLKIVDRICNKIPFIRVIYNTTREIVEVFSDKKTHPFKKVVIGNCLGKRRKILGFVTGESYDKNNRKYIHVYLPTPPNPVTGFLQLFREDQLEETNLDIEAGIKFALSVGSVSPKKIS